MHEPVLLVLDNVSGDTAAAALPFLAPRGQHSLLLATSWYAGAFAELRRAYTQAGHGAAPNFQVLSMAAEMPLQHRDAVQLISQQIQQCSVEPQALSDSQLAALADRAATALAFRHAPVYVPKILSVAACILGSMHEQTDALAALLAELQAARDPSVPDGPSPPAESTVFGQLRACYSRLPPPAQQMFIDLSRAHKQRAVHCSLEQLALWLSCRQADACSMELARAEVRKSPVCVCVRVQCSQLSSLVQHSAGRPIHSFN